MNAPEPSGLWVGLMLVVLLAVLLVAGLTLGIGWLLRANTPQPPNANEQADDERSLDSVRANLRDTPGSGPW
jgi:Tfp pilus assembly protein PilX